MNTKFVFKKKKPRIIIKNEKKDSHLSGSKQNYNSNKSEKTNHFDGHLDGLKHRQIRPCYPIVNLKSPFRKVLY
jgi:hypothetical protein